MKRAFVLMLAQSAASLVSIAAGDTSVSPGTIVGTVSNAATGNLLTGARVELAHLGLSTSQMIARLLTKIVTPRFRSEVFNKHVISMNPKIVRSALLACLLFLGASPTAFLARAAQPPARAVIYDESADGANQIADALARATKEKKRVLLQFGANWCGWCHKLHKLFAGNKDVAATLQRDYVVVLIDVNKGHNKETDAKFGQPTRNGLPVLVVLDADGRQLTTQETGSLEDGSEHSPAKVMAFLKKWASPRDKS